MIMQRNSNDDFIVTNLQDMIENKKIGEDKVKDILADFSCPKNYEIETFIKEKAINFSKEKKAITYLVFKEIEESYVLVAYYTIANKGYSLNTSKFSKTTAKRLIHIAGDNSRNGENIILATLLLAQLGKNYAYGNDLITGDELISKALNQIEQVQRLIGGRVCTIDCEDKQMLINFYKKYGFMEYDRTPLNEKEREHSDSENYVQMMKIFNV